MNEFETSETGIYNNWLDPHVHVSIIWNPNEVVFSDGTVIGTPIATGS